LTLNLSFSTTSIADLTKLRAETAKEETVL
jgi:hypothetical protein